MIGEANMFRLWGRVRDALLTLLTALPLVGLVLLFNVTGLRGIDFGYHWDEAEWHLDPAVQMIGTGVLLPHAYIYPSLDKALTVLPAVPIGLRTAMDSAGHSLPVQAAMLTVMNATDYLLSARAVFLVVSSMAIVWVYGAAIALRRKPLEALIAASCLGLSWEFAYHARWLVNDTLLVQFSALTLFTCALYQRSHRSVFLYAAAVAAGFGTGTKYTGVSLLVPVVWASLLAPGHVGLWARARRVMALCVVAGAAYLLTSPGTLLEPFKFIQDAHWITDAYKLHELGGYTVQTSSEHARIVVDYLALAYFSPYRIVAIALFAAVPIGAYGWVRHDWRLGLLLVGFPVLFLSSFCVQYRLVVVRNYLFAIPFLALLLARGVTMVSEALRWRAVQMALAIVLVGVGVAQASWLVVAAESIRHVDPAAYAKQAIDYVGAHPQLRFLVSQRVRALVPLSASQLPRNVVDDKVFDHVVFFAKADGPDPWHYKVNDPDLSEAVFGPKEVNYNWYSSWAGTDRVVIMTAERAKATGVPIVN